MNHYYDHLVTSQASADGSDSGAGSISLSSRNSGSMSSLRNVTRSPTPHSISGISLSSSGPVVTKSARLARSPVTVKSVPSKIHDVSDGVRPATTKAYEKNISSCKDHLVDENKDDYTRWVNYFHPNLVKEDIVTEMADGIKLITLVNTLTGQNLLPEKGNSMHHQTLNVEKVFNMLEREFHVDVQNLSPSDVVRGRRDAVLAVVWTLILSFSDGQIQDFDGLRAFLLQAEASHREGDITQGMLAPHDDGVKEFPHSLLAGDGSINQKIRSAVSSPVTTTSPQQLVPSAKEESLRVQRPDVTDSTPSSSKMEYITPDRLFLDLNRHPPGQTADRIPLKPIIKPTPKIVLPDFATNSSETWRGKTVRQRMYEVKEKSRAALLRNQLQNQSMSPFKKRKDRTAPPKHLEDQNRNLHLVHPVEEFVLESGQSRKDSSGAQEQTTASRPVSSLLSSLWNASPVRNALKVVLPLQILMLFVVGMSFMVPGLDEISCFDCMKENNYIKEFGPVFYHSFPPAV